MDTLTKNQWLLIGGAVVVIAAIGGWYWYGQQAPAAPATDATSAVLPQEEAVISDIGASVEAPAVKESIPTVAPSTNPIKNIYKNPFE